MVIMTMNLLMWYNVMRQTIASQKELNVILQTLPCVAGIVKQIHLHITVIGNSLTQTIPNWVWNTAYMGNTSSVPHLHANVYIGQCCLDMYL